MSAENGVIRFSLKRKELKVELEDAADGAMKEYTIKELTGEGRDAFLNAMSGKMKLNAEGKPSGVKDFSGLHSDLISRTLHDIHDHLVDSKTIQKWPTTVQTELFRMAQELSGLGNKAEEEAKNDS